MRAAKKEKKTMKQLYEAHSWTQKKVRERELN